MYESYELSWRRFSPSRSASSRRQRAHRGNRQSANKLTVWLQVDAQSGWPDVVAAANQQFQADHPGWTVDVQYQNWGDHLQKFDATLAGGNTPDVIEMGNTEMVKYMAAGAFADITLVQVDVRELGNWLAGPREVRHVRRQGLRRPVLRRLARRHVPHRRSSRRPGSRSSPTSLAQFTSDAKKLAAKNKSVKGFSPVYIAGTDWYFAMSFVYDFGGTIATTHAAQVGRQRSTRRSRSPV